jgi:flagellar motor switch protein FliN
MTETAAAVIRSETGDYIQAWSDSLAQALGQIAGSAIPCVPLTESPADLTTAAGGDVWVVCTCSGGLRGEMSLRLSAAATVRIAQIFMSEPADGKVEITADHREAVLEFLRQVAGLLATAVKARWGEVRFLLDLAAGAASWPASLTAWLRATETSAARTVPAEPIPSESGSAAADPAATVPAAILMELHLSAALIAALRADKPEAAKVAAAPTPPAARAAAGENEGKLALLMEVELAMTLRFGGRRMLLREILELGPGAVVELDRQVQEPVDLLLDGRLVARGEVVVMEGNYGLRVTELLPVVGM